MSRNRRIRIGVAAVVLAIVAGACSSDSAPDGSSATGGSTATGATATTPATGTGGTGRSTTGGGGGGGDDGPNVIKASDDQKFTPSTLKLKLQTFSGEKVVWRNIGSVAHTVTFRGGSFDRELPPGGRVEFQFVTTGTTNYFCKIHPGMEGRVVAEG